MGYVRPLWLLDYKNEAVDSNDNSSSSRYGRMRNPPGYLNDYTLKNVDFCYKVVPKSYKEAMMSDESNSWIKAIKACADDLSIHTKH